MYIYLLPPSTTPPGPEPSGQHKETSYPYYPLSSEFQTLEAETLQNYNSLLLILPGQLKLLSEGHYLSY